MAFQKASKQVAYAKIGAFGPTGSGKTTMLAMLLLYVSKELCGGKPVAFLDTEKGSDFIEPLFQAEGVDLLVNKSRAFIDLRDASKEAIKAGACAVGSDSLTHFWQELLAALKREKGVKRLTIDMIGQAKDQWHTFTESFVQSPIHYLIAGRLGNEWDNADVEDENGKIKTELVKGSTKMKAEGDTGYETDLLLELSSADDPDAADYKKLNRGGRIKKLASRQIHVALVKKCRVWALNGKMFTWPDAENYQPGDYKRVAECFLPYFQFLNIGGTHQAFDSSRNSQALFSGHGDGQYYRTQQQRQIALEDFTETVNRLFAGRDAATQKVRGDVVEGITGLRSKTAIENLSLDKMQRCSKIARALEAHIKQEPPSTPEEVSALLAMSIEETDQSVGDLGITSDDMKAMTGENAVC